jgi:hypothetical protein
LLEIVSIEMVKAKEKHTLGPKLQKKREKGDKHDNYYDKKDKGIFP